MTNKRLQFAESTTAARKLADGLRVLQVVESANAGVGRHTLDLCEGLLSRGCYVHLIYSALRIDSVFSDGLRALGQHRAFSATDLPMRREIHPADARAVRAVRRYLQTQGPFRVAHGHSSKAGAIVRMAAVGLPVKTIYTPHAIRTMDPQIRRSTRWVLGIIERGLAAIGTRVVALSPEEQAHLIQLGISDAKITLIPNGVDSIDLPTKTSARNALGLPGDRPIVGFIGRLAEQKGVDVLLEAFADVISHVPGAQLALLGTGKLENELRAQADRLGLAGHLHWLGHQPGFESMPAFDVFVLPSRYEGLPYVLLESLAAGTPAVVTDRASFGLLIENRANGIVVPAESSEQLAAAMVELLSDPEMRARFSDACRDRAKSFTREKMVDRTLALYQQLIAV